MIQGGGSMQQLPEAVVEVGGDEVTSRRDRLKSEPQSAI